MVWYTRYTRPNIDNGLIHIGEKTEIYYYYYYCESATAVFPSSTVSRPSSRMSDPAGAPNTLRYHRIAILRIPAIRQRLLFWIPDPETVHARATRWIVSHSEKPRQVGVRHLRNSR